MDRVSCLHKFVCESCYLYLAKQRPQNCNEINCVLLKQSQRFCFKIVLTISENIQERSDVILFAFRHNILLFALQKLKEFLHVCLHMQMNPGTSSAAEEKETKSRF